MDGSIRDGFEGLGYLAEFMIAVSVLVAILPVITIVLRLCSTAQHGKLSRDSYLWISLLAYLASVLAGVRFIPLSLTEEKFQTAIFAILGTLLAIASLILAYRSQGPGRLSAVMGAVVLTLIWVPFFFGRVLLQL